jgi:hypothetical protein
LQCIAKQFFFLFFIRVIVLKERNYIEYKGHTPRSINACYLVYLTKNNKKKKQNLKKKNLKKDKNRLWRQITNKSVDWLIIYETVLNRISKLAREIISHDFQRHQIDLKVTGIWNMVRALSKRTGSNKKCFCKHPDEINKSYERLDYISHTRWSKSRLRGLAKQVDA